MKLRVGSVDSALNARTFAIVPSSRYFAVARPRERSRRSLRRSQDALGVGGGDLRRRADGEGLDLLGAHDRAQPAAAGVAPVVARWWRSARRARRPCRSRRPATRRRAARARAPRPRRPCGPTPRAASSTTTSAALDAHDRRPVGPADEHDRVVAGQLAADGEVAGRERVGEQAGERRLRDDGELRARGQRRPDQRGEDERERRLGRERVDAGRAELGQQPGAEADAAEVVAQDLLGQRQELGWRRCRRRRRAPGRSNRRDALGDVLSHRRPPTGRRRRRPRRGAARRRATVWSPLTAASRWRSRTSPTACAACAERRGPHRAGAALPAGRQHAEALHLHLGRRQLAQRPQLVGGVHAAHRREARVGLAPAQGRRAGPARRAPARRRPRAGTPVAPGPARAARAPARPAPCGSTRRAAGGGRRRPAGPRRRPARPGRRPGRRPGAAAAGRSSRRTACSARSCSAARPVAMPSSGPRRLRRVVEHLDRGRQRGQRPGPAARTTTTGPSTPRDTRPTTRRSSVEPCHSRPAFGCAHPGRPAAGQHDCCGRRHAAQPTSGRLLRPGASAPARRRRRAGRPRPWRRRAAACRSARRARRRPTAG